GADFFAAARRKFKDASGLVKSTITAPALSAGAIWSVTKTPSRPAPEISPASLPRRTLPGLSIAAASLKSADCWIARTTAPPIRPPTPQTMMPSAIIVSGLPGSGTAPGKKLRSASTGSARTESLPSRKYPGGPVSSQGGSQQAEIAHRLGEFFEIPFGHRRQRKAPLAAALAHQRQRGLHGDRIGLDEYTADHRHQPELQLPAFFPPAVQAGFGERRGFSGRDVVDRRDHALAAQRHQRKDQRIFAGVNREALAAQADHIDRLVHRAGRFFDPGDVFDFGQARESFRLDLRAGAAGNVVDDDRNADRRSDFFVVLVNAFLGRAVVIGRNHQRAVGAGFLRLAGEPHRFVGGIGAGAGDHRHAPVDLLDHRADDFIVLLMAERRRLAGG